MMDFLRQLNPARETDAARAVAVLPSRFSGLHPLQGILEHAQPGQSPGDDETSPWPQAGLPPVARPMAAQRPAAASHRPGQAVPIPLVGETMQGENEKALSPSAITAKSPDAPEVPSSRTLQNRAGDNAERARPASAQATSPVTAVLPAIPAFQEASAPPVPAQEAWPLSDASLAQRVPRSQDDSPTVHVTIGRIEVVAHTASAPAPQRGPAPQQPSVTLADYLRGSPGSRP
jgi:hypothetical protein